MSLMFVVGLMMAQAPATSEQPAETETKKQAKVCQMISVTGSRSKKRVCRNANGELDLGPGVSNSGFGKAKIDMRGVGMGTQSTAQ